MSAEEKFLLKNYLFNKEKVAKISSEILAVWPEFESSKFKKKVVTKFPKLELMERVYWIRDCLREFLPDDYQEAVKILLESLPPPCDPTLSDDDFGDFIYAPYGYFVAEYGCQKKDLTFSLIALRQLTTRFSMEGPIRFFINEFPRETIDALKKWSRDSHYHIRRLASEGTRPSLPWAKKIDVNYEDMVEILNILHSDKTRFVTRSVANHINDISKIDPKLVIKILKVWRKLRIQNEKELDFIIKHSLRTLVKDGHEGALGLLGYSTKDIKVKNFKINTPKVKVGSSLEFSFDVISTGKEKQDLMIDYILYFKKANGDLSPKTHKIAKKIINPKETVTINKKHPLRKMTTRKLYVGLHKLELQINGHKFGIKEFTLIK
ncbi:DNA alkylation repair protein [Candidatus Kaiserbacteria bacterium]|nr:DNA alkylation repair protein [Candidatus Kaiserbacteria bacterium]